MTDLTTRLGPLTLRSPLVAASGTVGSVVDFASVGVLEVYGAATAKSVSGKPWPGRRPPRIGMAGVGMLNGIGIQNPGVEAWVAEVGPQLEALRVPVWGSVVGETVAEFAHVAERLAATSIEAVEINLSCPNLEGGGMWALDPDATREVVAAVRRVVHQPVGAKLSPNAQDIVGVARAAVAGGADWLVLTNTAWGAGIDIETRKPVLSGGIGGYSGAPLKPIALRCVLEVHQAMPEVPIVGCGGVRTGADVVEYMLAGASAVAIGTAHFDRPRVGRTIVRQIETYCRKHGIERIADLVGGLEPW